MNRLKQVRQEKGFTQFQLAKMADVHPIDISRIERGVIRPYPNWRKRIAKALGVSEDVLFPEE